MARSRDTAVLIAVLVAASAIALGACGGGDSKDKGGSASTTTGAGATGAANQGATGDSGGASAGTGGSGAASGGKSEKGKKGKSKGGSGGSGSSSGAGGNGSAGGGGGRGDATPQYGTLQERELYRQSKIVCRALSLKGLAHEYEVPRTPDAVARAYAKGYSPNIRGAVFQGCRAAFVKQ